MASEFPLLPQNLPRTLDKTPLPHTLILSLPPPPPINHIRPLLRPNFHVSSRAGVTANVYNRISLATR